MIIFKHSKDLKAYLKKSKSAGISVGFVPTMGALHAGHLSLVSYCKSKTGLTVCSIFINPTQFNNAEDFKKYPVTLEKNISLLEKGGCNVLFIPNEKEMYPDEASKAKKYNIGFLETILEGKFRPGHFQGVCLVVERLLNIVEPGFLFIGQKDFQQCLVLKRLVEIMQKKIEIIICPTLREISGLAMSSRNLRLSDEEKQTAPLMYGALQSIKENIAKTAFPQLQQQAISYLEEKGFKVDYLQLAKTENLEIVTEAENKNGFSNAYFEKINGCFNSLALCNPDDCRACGTLPSPALHGNEDHYSAFS